MTEQLLEAPHAAQLIVGEVQTIVTDALMGMISGVTGMSPPAGERPPAFIQSAIDRAVTRVVAKLRPEREAHWAREAALQQRLNEADQRIDELERDKQRLDALEGSFWEVRHHSSALADTGDYTSCVEIVGHWMEQPRERVIGENYNENLRAAIDQAMAADAYPPARPEYPELDAALDQLINYRP